MPYASLENPDTARRATSDPRAFLTAFPKGVILDEIQRAPELLSYIQGIVDEDARPGRFVLTGSAQLELLGKVSQSLAGRTALLTLLPFTLSEVYSKSTRVQTEALLFRGFFPRVHAQKLDVREAMDFYCATYLERDVRNVLQVRDLGQFDSFLRLSATRTGQVLNVSGLGAEAGVSNKTATHWLSVLQATFLVFLLRPHHTNLGKRLIKAPKLHWIDSGLCAYLLEMRTPDHIATHPMRGALFESFVAAELMKQACHAGRRPNLYYFRDNHGLEIDLLMDFGDRIVPIEVKIGQTVNQEFFRSLDEYGKLNQKAWPGILVYGGKESYVENGRLILGYRDLPLLMGYDGSRAPAALLKQ
jgi:predicted AAA+ superfamily ATPase